MGIDKYHYVYNMPAYVNMYDISWHALHEFCFKTNSFIQPIKYEVARYHISRNIDSDFNLAIWQSRKDHQINLHHYWSIYATSMDFLHTILKSVNSISHQQHFFEQTAKYNAHQ